MTHYTVVCSSNIEEKYFLLWLIVTKLAYLWVWLLVSPHVYVWVRTKHFGCHSVCLSSREFTFRSLNLNIACSTATSLTPLMEKVSSYCIFVSREPCKVQEVKKVRKAIFGHMSLKFHFRRSIKGLKIFQHIIFKTYVQAFFFLTAC